MFPYHDPKLNNLVDDYLQSGRKAILCYFLKELPKYNQPETVLFKNSLFQVLCKRASSDSAYLKTLASARQQTLVGACYAKGVGVHPDINIAESFYRLAADKDEGNAQFLLSKLLYTKLLNQNLAHKDRLIYEQDFSHYLRRAYANQVTEAFTALAGLYEHGYCVPNQSYEQAFELYKKAAINGCGKAQGRLATCYRKRLTLAASNGDHDSVLAFGLLVYLGKIDRYQALNTIGAAPNNLLHHIQPYQIVYKLPGNIQNQHNLFINEQLSHQPAPQKNN